MKGEYFMLKKLSGLFSKKEEVKDEITAVNIDKVDDYTVEEVEDVFANLKDVTYNLYHNPRGVSEFIRGIFDELAVLTVKPKVDRHYFVLASMFPELGVESDKIYLLESKEIIPTSEKAINFSYTFDGKLRNWYFIIDEYPKEFKANYVAKDTDILSKKRRGYVYY